MIIRRCLCDRDGTSVSLKVLWLTSSFPTHPENGKNLYLWHPLEALKKLGVTPVVLNMQPWKPIIKHSIDRAQFSIDIKNHYYFSIPRHYFRSISNYFYLFKTVRVIKKLNKLHHFDVIHAHGEIAGLAAVKISKQLNIPAVVTIHGIDMCKRVWSGFSGKQFEKMFNRVGKIIYVGESLKKYFQNKLDGDPNFCVLHNGFRMPSSQQLEKRVFENKKTIHLISVSNLHEGKGVDLTLRALICLKNQGIDNWFYTIIGDGDQKNYLEGIIAQFDLSNQVRLIGACLHEIVYEHLQKSDVFCLPSYREAFGIAYVEAMAQGLLTIGVKGQGPQAFIEHGKTGLLIEPQNTDDLVQALHLAITQFQNMKEVAYAGQQYVLENFTWETHAEKLFTIYEEICT